MLHFGTHGSLEFMPGKQVGMSGVCYPDSLIGDLPNLYYYAANNPSEATIAKRRSYANTISYLTPPAENAGLYKGLKVCSPCHTDLIAPAMWTPKKFMYNMFKLHLRRIAFGALTAPKVVPWLGQCQPSCVMMACAAVLDFSGHALNNSLLHAGAEGADCQLPDAQRGRPRPCHLLHYH